MTSVTQRAATQCSDLTSKQKVGVLEEKVAAGPSRQSFHRAAGLEMAVSQPGTFSGQSQTLCAALNTRLTGQGMWCLRSPSHMKYRVQSALSSK